MVLTRMNGSIARIPRATLAQNKQADFLSSDGFEPSAPPKKLLGIVTDERAIVNFALS